MCMITVYVFSNRVRAKATASAAVRKNPLVKFNYPSSKHDGIPIQRRVWLISSTATHFTGLEQTCGGKGGGTHYRYKKFLHSKAQNFTVASFNPASMS
ncbi:Uncharacterised protein [uncultured archaeon]|nr:Uncharacterised protein [uncultured archaeon]